MGGKRPDQHNLDPGEGKATDYKFRRTPADDLEHPISDKGGQPIKPTIPSPDANNPTAKKNKDAEQDDDS